MAQLVEWPTLDFGSGHDLRVLGLCPGSGTTLWRACLEILSLSPVAEDSS